MGLEEDKQVILSFEDLEGALFPCGVKILGFKLKDGSVVFDIEFDKEYHSCKTKDL